VLFLFWYSDTKTSIHKILHSFEILPGKSTLKEFVKTETKLKIEENTGLQQKDSLSLAFWLDNFIKFHCIKNTTVTNLELIQKNRSSVTTYEKLSNSVKINRKFKENFTIIFNEKSFGKN